jgi:hypothetical protein
VFRTLRENGPALLVPLAWAFVTAASLGYVAQRTLLAAHVVMDVLLVGFAVLSWGEMRDGVLLAWRRIIVAGFVGTLAGTLGLLASPPVPSLLRIAVLGWMVLPAVGLLYTGHEGAAFARVHVVGGALSLLGAVAYGVGTLTSPMGATGAAGVGVAALVGLGLVGVGQTAGIVAAVVSPASP